ncbi:g13405 [Coccomyxa viridis]|uniref:G13405 protein n=1 Tax=Coccomyxa viridis TaxID=1274662 RepID=A0ABP1GHD1_9CHLO
MALRGVFSHSVLCPSALPLRESQLTSRSSGRSRARNLVSAAYNSGPNSYAGPNSSLLDAFYYGKAFAETLNEKLGTVLDDVLANIGKQDAERREALREFQEEVEERARRDISQSRDSAGSVSTGSAAYASPTSMTMQGGRASSNGAPPPSRQAFIATPPDLQETVDDLRAEMALTRISVKALKAKQQPSTL